MKTVAEKLQIKPGDAVLVAGGTPERLALLDPLPAGAAIGGDAPAVAILFAEDRAALESLLAEAAPHLAAARVRWIAYPKGNRADINRDTIWALVQEHGWTLNFNVAVSDVWSALRFKAL
ncbi:hypothetical protein [Demequina soli]|uniref:hypothetical protein n=1 Tax=Demequina soli TaxID=1638987 RepID=UPI0007862AD8|nr:hypothetical protein [Demequina soli]